MKYSHGPWNHPIVWYENARNQPICKLMTLEEKLYFANCVMQLQMLYATKKCRMQLFISCMWDVQLQKTIFLLVWTPTSKTSANDSVATPLWPSVSAKPNICKVGDFGVLRDSRMFRVRQQGPKHLALGCS
jgi:hypothetical protein